MFKIDWKEAYEDQILDTVNTERNILDEAREIVDVNREGSYGGPEKNIITTAKLWSAYLGIEVIPENVCDMMGLLKLARLRSNPDHHDSRVDLIGYAYLKERLK